MEAVGEAETDVAGVVVVAAELVSQMAAVTAVPVGVPAVGLEAESAAMSSVAVLERGAGSIEQIIDPSIGAFPPSCL